MHDQIRCWLKFTAALAMGLIIYWAANPSRIQEVVFGCKALFIGRFGTAAQLEALTDEAGRMTAAANGDLEMYEARRAFREAIDTQERLARMDEDLADDAIRVAISERHARQSAAAAAAAAAAVEDYPHFSQRRGKSPVECRLFDQSDHERRRRQ